MVNGLSVLLILNFSVPSLAKLPDVQVSKGDRPQPKMCPFTGDIAQAYPETTLPELAQKGGRIHFSATQKVIIAYGAACAPVAMLGYRGEATCDLCRDTADKIPLSVERPKKIQKVVPLYEEPSHRFMGWSLELESNLRLNCASYRPQDSFNQELRDNHPVLTLLGPKRLQVQCDKFEIRKVEALPRMKAPHRPGDALR